MRIKRACAKWEGGRDIVCFFQPVSFYYMCAMTYLWGKWHPFRGSVHGCLVGPHTESQNVYHPQQIFRRQRYQ